MIRPEGVPEYRRLRAPGRDGETLVDPALEAISARVADNIQNCHRSSGDLLGKSRAELARAARLSLQAAATRYTAEYRTVDQTPLDADTPILLSGHQPQLFHAGVWFKNFVNWQLGQRLGTRAIHLLIDSDTQSTPAIRVPTGPLTSPTVEYVALDRATDAIPYEERRILDSELFASFASRVTAKIRPLITQPLVTRLWPFAISAIRRHANLGRAVAEARHRVEGEWGIETLEVPFSELCETETFHWFLVHLLANLPRFLEVYNTALLDYRRANRIRSRSHPVPQLARMDDWLEAPFWIWSGDNPRRRRLFVRHRGRELELTDRDGLILRVDAPAERSAENAIGQLTEIRRNQAKIRSRALTTTMYARLFLGDYFLHGIGGAKYDQLTDAIIEQFFGWQPPYFGVATATLMLPIARPTVELQQLRTVEQQLREMRFHPERFISHTAATQQIVGAKRRWIATELPRGKRLRRHIEIAHANHALQDHLVTQRSELANQREQLKHQLRSERLLGSREFSFCLFPERTLRDHLLDF